MSQCTAHKKGGGECRAQAVAGTNVCRVHGGNAPQVRRRAALRLLEASDSAAAYLVKVVENERKPDAIRLAAARDLLDRAGLSGKERVEVEIAPPKKAPWEELLPKIFHVAPPQEELPTLTTEDVAGSVPPANSEAAHRAYLANRYAVDPMPPGAEQRVDGAPARRVRRRA